MKIVKLFKMKILLISAFVLLCGCPDKIEQEFIYIENRSDKTITFDFSINKQDTTFYCSDTGRTVLIAPNSKVR